MTFRKLPVKLQDCVEHGTQSGAELFIVEGDSASQAVTAIRNEQFQAVLPMQGKPLNAHKASWNKLLKFELFAELLRALGYPADGAEKGADRSEIDPDQCRFERVIFLFDPDADGIHCEALMLMFFHRMLKPLLARGRLYSVRAPMFQFTLEYDLGRNSKFAASANACGSVNSASWDSSDGHPASAAKPLSAKEKMPRYAYSEEEAKRLFAQLESLDIRVKRIRYRGLAGMHREALLETCVAPKSRCLRQLALQDAQAALTVFGPA